MDYKLIAADMDGTLLDPVTHLAPKGYEDIVVYRRIRSITVTGSKQICIDGEIQQTDRTTATVIPRAVQYRI